MPTGTAYAAILAGVVAVLVGALYIFGIPPAWKRAMEEKALETMGENKASYLMKDQISKIPASDQKEVSDIRSGLGNAAGGLLQNPMGKAVGNAGDEATRPLTGR
ncbi:hypothetical protein AAFC00_006994 [Neodothiora populina]|uniref:Uncharacterized protein n=1 Tax=Neodothiora populina TaxID=2781224 RepID=A0ABR3PC24_9PEZI